MSMPARASTPSMASLEQLRMGREIVQLEGRALLELSRRLDGAFCRACDVLVDCQGSVLTCGIGKAGLIAQKVAATLASTGTRSHFLHPGEAVHGDLGRIGPHDVLLVFSQSGETEEIVRLLPSLRELGVQLIAITAQGNSTLGRCAQITLQLGPLQEAGTLGLAPTTSTAAMMALGDALALVASRRRNFRREDFARYHPGGSLGRQLSKVDDYMRPLADCRVASESQNVRQVFIEHSRAGRRSGAIMLTDGRGRLAGLFTDSDLARLFENHREDALDRPIREVMTSRPCTTRQGSMMIDAVAIMADRKISELPVIDAADRPRGLIDITDVLGLFPEAAPPADEQSETPGVAKFPTARI